MAPREKILILDFGSQYTKLIAKGIRELGAYCEIVPFDLPARELEGPEVKGLILSGGPASVYEPGAPRPDRGIWELGLPILGICYGMQLLAWELGGRVARAKEREYGPRWLELLTEDELFAGLERRELVWMSHGDSVVELPEGFIALARTEAVPYAAIRHRQRPLFGLQFHPEVVHTPKGKKLLENFVFRICGVRERWDPAAADHLEQRLAALRKQLRGIGGCLAAVSGGVDSTTAAVLVHRAIGDRLIPIFVDTGLMRLGEGDRVRRALEGLGLKVHCVEASERFFAALRGVTDPEEKRRRIGRAFIEVFEEEARRLAREHERGCGPIEALVQGTIYSDVIESAGARGARRIKSHHNVGGLPERLNLKLIEPLRDLFKDEVRALARRLGLPDEIIREQPFPGPGLAVRILGEVTPERARRLQQADAIFREEVEWAGLAPKLWQYFAVLLPHRSVAILGDERGYGEVVALRAVHSVDGMTAAWFPLPYELLERVASRITSEVPGVTRVVYDITSKPPGTIEWE